MLWDIPGIQDHDELDDSCNKPVFYPDLLSFLSNSDSRVREYLGTATFATYISITTRTRF